MFFFYYKGYGLFYTFAGGMFFKVGTIGFLGILGAGLGLVCLIGD